ncbi:MAG: AAA family ATPase [Ktedonobacteraceae bacterium]|nr:AAA family ATPase [Ktedonobacteraceae bacterium]
MNNNTTSQQAWSFPFCPVPPHWALDWEDLQAQFSWLQAMEGVPQSPIYHAEGDVLIHTHNVVEALTRTEEWRNLPILERELLFASTLLHDIGKPVCTKIDEAGHISSRGHAQKGEFMVRQLLWLGEELTAPLPLVPREYIASMVRFHGLPLQFLHWTKPERALIAASQRVRMDHIALLAEADVKGRICQDTNELLERIALFRELCKECLCYDGPRQFPDAYSRFLYFQRDERDPNYKAYDDTEFEVVLMSGLPGVGKDTWIRQHLADRPVIALDALRRKLKISAEDDQGPVITAAKEQARELMRKKQSFVWNATNITRMMRQQLIELFLSYNARVRIVYLDAPFKIILQRNHDRQNSVPEQVIYKLLSKLEVPTLIEAHQVDWICEP